MWWCRARDSANAKLAERSLKGKGDSARQRDYCPFAMVVRMERLGATECNPSVLAAEKFGE